MPLNLIYPFVVVERPLTRVAEVVPVVVVHLAPTSEQLLKPGEAALAVVVDPEVGEEEEHQLDHRLMVVEDCYLVREGNSLAGESQASKSNYSKNI